MGGLCEDRSNGLEVGGDKDVSESQNNLRAGTSAPSVPAACPQCQHNLGAAAGILVGTGGQMKLCGYAERQPRHQPGPAVKRPHRHRCQGQLHVVKMSSIGRSKL